MTRWRLAFVIGAVIALGLLSPALARDVTDAERTLLSTTVGEFDSAIRGNDFARIVDTLPPKIFETLAADNRMTVEELRTVTIEQSKEAMKSVIVVSFGMDLDKASFASAADDSPYALIPTETVMTLGGSKVRATGDTLALLDGDKWYLVRVSEAPQAEMLKKVYPAFAAIQFTPGTMETVKE